MIVDRVALPGRRVWEVYIEDMESCDDVWNDTNELQYFQMISHITHIVAFCVKSRYRQIGIVTLVELTAFT